MLEQQGEPLGATVHLRLVEKLWKRVAELLTNPLAAQCLRDAECIAITDPLLDMEGDSGG